LFDAVTTADTGRHLVVFGLPFLGDEELDGLPNKFSRAVSEQALGFGMTRPDRTSKIRRDTRDFRQHHR
jgi:hypothetical protein